VLTLDLQDRQLFTTGSMPYTETILRSMQSTNRESESGQGVAEKIAELFVEVLAAAGVERIYGVAGDSLNGITDFRALARRGSVHAKTDVFQFRETAIHRL
jgi:hypothetical protein